MSQANWNDLASPALDTSKVNRGVTNALTPPTGGGSFVYGFKSLDTSTGVAGKVCNIAGTAPITGTKKCGRMSAVMKKYTASSLTSVYAPFFGFLVGVDVSSSYGYFLSLSDDVSYRIILKKGLLTGGLSAGDAGVLRQSTQGYTNYGDGTSGWFHLRLDVLVNPHGEVVLSTKLNTGTIAAPVWSAVAGMADYTDDAIGILSGTSPYLQGFYLVYGHYTESASGAVSLFDQIEPLRQISP
ncbi:MAG: hypothetical protein FJ098_00725 [Deltaproteobacteria bacterium]|nr:hypothetical protein [Deltaproteobacteria bacterium]